VEGLREAIKEASEKLKEKEVRLNVVNFPFTDVEDIRAVMTMEKCDGDVTETLTAEGDALRLFNDSR
jgi:hypothetical protein